MARGTLRITDHKTGKPPRTCGPFGSGTLLQPLAYALTAKACWALPWKSPAFLLHATGQLSGNPVRQSHPGSRLLRPRHVAHRCEIIAAFCPPRRSRAPAPLRLLPVCGPNEAQRTAEEAPEEPWKLCGSEEHSVTPGDPDRRRSRARAHPRFAGREPHRGGFGGHRQDLRAGPPHRARAGCRNSGRQIVAVTFTHKAAGELKIRLREELDKARSGCADRRPRARASEDALERLEEAAIGTIHGFCAQILRERPVEARIDPGFEELTEPEAARMCARAFDLWFQRKLDAGAEALRRALARLAWRESWQAEVRRPSR